MVNTLLSRFDPFSFSFSGKYKRQDLSQY